MPIDEGVLAAMPDAAANVAGVYAALCDDIAGGTSNAAGFRHAVRFTWLVADLLDSSRAGDQTLAADWPDQAGLRGLSQGCPAAVPGRASLLSFSPLREPAEVCLGQGGCLWHELIRGPRGIPPPRLLGHA